MHERYKSENAPAVGVKSLRAMFVPSSAGCSHILRLALIARELSAHGVTVGFAIREGASSAIDDDFALYEVPDADLENFGGDLFGQFDESLVRRCVESELLAIHRFVPRVIVGDLRPTAAISARLTRIPYISVVNGYMTNQFDPVDAMIPREQRPIAHAFASAVGRLIQARQKRTLARPFRRVARELGVKGLSSLYDFLEGDLTLIADHPAYCPLAGLSKNHRYIGPLVWEGGGEDSTDSGWSSRRDRPLLYATLGNTGSLRLAELVFEAFSGDRSWNVVLTTGAFIDPQAVPRAANIHVERFIPGSQIAKHCRAAIHCGGNGTTYQMMAQGVPSVVVPFNNDQKINAWLIKRRRVGLPLSPEALTGKTLKMAVESVLEDVEMTESLERFRGLLSEVDGPQNAAREILSFLESRREPSEGASTS